MIFIPLIVHNRDRMSSITRVLHTTTWDYFTSHLPGRFCHSSIVVQEAIMTDINALVQEFWRTSTDGVVGVSFFKIRRLLEILQRCLNMSEVGFVIISVLPLPSTYLIKSHRCRQAPILTSGTTIPSSYQSLTTESEPNIRRCLISIERCLISQFLNPKTWVTCSGFYLVS